MPGGAIELHCVVTDSGIGLSDKSRQKLFQPFTQGDTSTTRRFGGTGLGLAICRKLVELMHGTIGVNSTEGQGSSFWFKIQVEAGHVPGSVTVGGLTDASRQTKFSDSPLLRVLLAEDNAVNQRVAIHQLHKLGCEIKVASDGLEALADWENGHYDLLFMDCQMPGLDGCEVTRRIRALEKERSLAPVRIVAMTASAMQGDREKCLQAGMDDYISKPVKLEELQKLLQVSFPARFRRNEEDLRTATLAHAVVGAA